MFNLFLGIILFIGLIVFAIFSGGSIETFMDMPSLIIVVVGSLIYSFSAGGPNKMGVGASVAFVIFACILTIAVARIIVSKRLRKES